MAKEKGRFQVHGDYLGPPFRCQPGSIRNAGLDPDHLPVPETPGKYRSRDDRAKTWTDIWGAGQGVGQIVDAPPAGEIVARLKAEYDAARAALFAGETVPTSLKQAAE